MSHTTDNLITEAPSAWLQAIMDMEPKHMGDTDILTEHEHPTLESLFTCTDNLCTSILSPVVPGVQYVGKHGVKYARGN